MGNASSASAAPSLKPVAETSSSCITQGITAAHNFEVINFSLLEGMGVGEEVTSSKFHVGGYDWSISLFPDGHSEEHHKHYVSVYLNPEGEGPEGVRVRFTFSFCGMDGRLWDIPRNCEHTFRSDFRGIGWPRFMYKSWIFGKLLRMNNDGFTVRCVLTVIQDPRVITIGVPQPSVLQRDFATMLRNGNGADVTFVVGERSFPAHRCVLAARSAVFNAELFGPMKEKTAMSVRVDDMEPSVFEALLHFIYTESLPDDGGGKDSSVAMMQHLLVAADRYGLDSVKVICEDKLCHAIDVETVATTLTLAEQHHCVKLKDGCLRFMASRDVLGAVMKTDGYKHLVTSCPLLRSKILDKME